MFVFVVYGPAVIDHSFLVAGLLPNSKIRKEFDVEKGSFCVRLF